MTEVDDRQFDARYRQVYSHPPGPFAPLAYDAVRVLLASLERLDGPGLPERARVAAEIRSTRNFPGLLGPINFDGRGDLRRAPFAFFTIDKGRFVPVRDVPAPSGAGY
jgi:ABC-type branched-subunit amino acid transport system substrate-binding protein